MKFLSYFIRKHWFWALIILLLLWLLPKLLNAYALVLEKGKGLVDSVGGILKLPGETVAKLKDGLSAAGRFLEKYPIVTAAVPLFLLKRAPAVSAFFAVWSLLDLFKGDETMTYTRNVSASQVPGPVPPLSTPTLPGDSDIFEPGPQPDAFGNFFAPPL